VPKAVALHPLRVHLQILPNPLSLEGYHQHMAPCLKGPDLQVFTLNLLIYQTVKLLKSVEKPSNLPRLLKFEVD